MRAVIIANGPMTELPFPELAVRDEDLVICVNGGARNALAMGFEPRLVVGDMDSMETELRERLEQQGCRFVEYPSRKDETDSELAVRLALAEGATELVILAALGGRIDHTLANVLLLTIPELRQVATRLVDGSQEVSVTRESIVIEGRVGDTVSLVPLAGDVVGVFTEGLEYALSGGTLSFGAARGVSNVLVSSEAKIKVGDGLLLVVHHHRAPLRGAESGPPGEDDE